MIRRPRLPAGAGRRARSSSGCRYLVNQTPGSGMSCDGSKMPRGGSLLLAEIDGVRNRICCGAQNDQSMRTETRLRAAAAVALGLLLFLLPRSAAAYPWMIRHGYAECRTCHTDPSGGGLLSRYGRVEAARVLSAPLALGRDEAEPGALKDFAFGVVPLPEAVDAQGWLRSAYVVNVAGGEVVDHRYALMRADVGTHLRAGVVRASGTIGGATADARGLTQDAWITTSETGANLVSREHWVGVDLADRAVLLRAGRIAMPFGLRNVEHVSWVRRETRTDTNQHQQHGVALAYGGGPIRAEGMVVLGNFQLGPDAYRERGYSAYGEYLLGTTTSLGVSSAVLRADADAVTRQPVLRQAHGAFARISPVTPLVLLAEGDAIVRSVKGDDATVDFAGLLQADLEVTRGLHVVGTGEMLTASRSSTVLGGAWLSAWYFLFAHMDLRLDLIHRGTELGPATTTALLQFHGWL